MTVPLNSLTTELIYYITSNQENLNLQTLLGSAKYQAAINKKVIINNGITVGATNTSNYALNIPSGFGGKIILVNNGSIQGAGGAAGSGTGGNAIFAGASNILIDNRGTIYSGGGGGGAGGAGGAGGGGSYVQASNYNYSCCVQYCYDLSGASFCNILYGGNICLQTGTCTGTNYTTIYTSGGGGGAGGNGGRGRGYDGALAAGSAGAGGSAGGTNAGTGGTGGTGGAGGDWGASGATGNTGNGGSNGNYTAGLGGSAGSSGGLAGFYIVNNGNVTWLANGTRAGRVG